MSSPITYVWTGEVMKPLGAGSRLTAEHEFVSGEVYRLERVHERSEGSHRHYFAAINMAWQNLPEVLAHRWKDPERLRKWALIQSGFFVPTTYPAQTKGEARRMARYVVDTADDEIQVEVEGCVVLIKKAMSQSYRAMPGKEFARSKEAVLNIVSALIGTDASDLQRQVEDPPHAA